MLFVNLNYMQITVTVPEELATQAHKRGVRLETYVEALLVERAGEFSGTPRPRTPLEVREWLDSLAQFSDKIPPLPETISREWLYQDHD